MLIGRASICKYNVVLLAGLQWDTEMGNRERGERSVFEHHLLLMVIKSAQRQIKVSTHVYW